jgi:hypothetical protein
MLLHVLIVRVTLNCGKEMFTIEMGLWNYGRFDEIFFEHPVAFFEVG